MSKYKHITCIGLILQSNVICQLHTNLQKQSLRLKLGYFQPKLCPFRSNCSTECPKHCFFSKTRMTLQEVTSSQLTKTRIGSQGSENTTCVPYSFCHLIHSSKTTAPMVLQRQNSSKCSLYRVKKNSLESEKHTEGILGTEKGSIIETEGL